MGSPVKHRIAFAFAAGLVLSAGLIGPTRAQTVQHPELLFVPIKPCRVLDTTKTSLIAVNTTRTFSIAGTGSQFAAQGGTTNGCGVPDLAAAVVISFTSGNATGAGGLTAFGGATASAPGTRLLSFVKTQNSTASATVAVENKQIKVSAVFAGTNLFGDITGYFIPQIEAQINSDGSIQTGTTRVLAVTKGGTGLYYIDVDREARSCTPQATTYNVFRYASAGYSSVSTPNRLSVYTWYINNGTPTPIDYPFHFHVNC